MLWEQPELLVLARLELQVHRVSRVLTELTVVAEQLGQLVHRVQLVLAAQDLPVLLEQLAHLGQVQQVQPELAQLVLRVLMVCLGLRVYLEMMVPPGQLVPVRPALRAQMVKAVPLVRPAHKDPQDLMVSRDPPELQDLLAVQLELQVWLEQQEAREPQELALLVQLVLRGHQDWTVLKVLLVLQDLPVVQLEPRA